MGSIGQREVLPVVLLPMTRKAAAGIIENLFGGCQSRLGSHRV